jgi:glucose-1-phosphate cytidylyltransferase
MYFHKAGTAGGTGKFLRAWIQFESMEKNEMKVVILAGGLGTRLREETETKPKPMVPIGGKPVLWHIMKIYSHYGFSDFIISAGYKGEVIKKYFLDYPYLNNDFTIEMGERRITVHDKGEKERWNVTVVDTGMDTMTGGRIKGIERYVKEGPFMATYGDGLSNVNLDNLLEFHRSHGKMATLTAVRPSSRFGEVRMGEDGVHVYSFDEKPQIEEGWVSGGFFVFEKGIFGRIPNALSNLEKDVLEPIAKEGQLAAYKHDGNWRCMDTYREFKLLNGEWDGGKAGWKVW